VNEALNMAKENIDKKTLKESVKKFSSFLALKEIGNETIKEEDVRFYKNCNKLISENKKMGNLSDYTNTLNEVAEYVEKHKKNPNLQDVDKLTEDLSQKIANLSEESQSLVKDIIDFKNPMVEENQKKVFNRFKNECLDQINVLKETITDQTELNGLESLKEDIEKRIYCKETIVKDLATLLEIRDILLEK
jgi:archaellum component FlaC